MDQQALKRQLRAKFEATMHQAMAAVETAPDGQWIAASEWAVRDAFQGLMRECFQEIVQAKIDADPVSNAGSFSPGARPARDGGGGGGGAAVQGRAAGRRAHRRR
jgi:hypothetical protein